MDADALKALQAPLKDKYRQEPETAVVTLRSEGRIGEDVTCSVATSRAIVEAGLHPVGRDARKRMKISRPRCRQEISTEEVRGT